MSEKGVVGAGHVRGRRLRGRDVIGGITRHGMSGHENDQFLIEFLWKGMGRAKGLMGKSIYLCKSFKKYYKFTNYRNKFYQSVK